jgi:hypothetical protein
MNPLSVFSFFFRWLDGRTVTGKQPIKGSDAGDPATGGEVAIEVAAEAVGVAVDFF